MDPLVWHEIAARLGTAVVVGALVGLERERKHRPAGFRTMILVSLGSACFMVAGHELIAQSPQSAVPAADLSRILQGLIGGIGFLGAGAVIQSKRAVRGMTTAAAVWVVAALGAAAGMGLYNLVLAGGVMALFTLVVLEVFEDRFFPDQEDDFAPKRDKGKHGKGGNGSANGDAEMSEGQKHMHAADD